MDAGRLRDIVRATNAIAGQMKLVAQLDQLLAALTSYATSPQQPELATTLQALWDGILQDLRSPANNLHAPSEIAILRAIGTDEYVGVGLARELEKIRHQNGLTPALAATSLEQLATGVKAEMDSLARVDKLLDNFRVADLSLTPGETAVGVRLPAGDESGSIADLHIEVRSLRLILRGFTDLTGCREQDIQVRSLGKGCWEFDLATAFLYGSAFAKAIDMLAGTWLKIEQVRDLRKQMAEAKAPEVAMQAMEARQRDILAEDIDVLGDMLIRDYGSDDAKSRKDEVKVGLTNSLRLMAKKIDKGADFEVRAEPPDDPDDVDETSGEDDEQQPEDTASALAVQQARDLIAAYERVRQDGARLRTLPADRSGVLLLPAVGDLVEVAEGHIMDVADHKPAADTKSASSKRAAAKATKAKPKD